MNRTAAASKTAVEAWQLLLDFFMSLDPHWHQLASEFGLSEAQGEALVRLRPDEPVPMHDLANLCHCDPSNVTGIVDRLEARGYVERRPAAHDRRVKLIALTPEGERVREEAVKRMYDPPPQIAALPAADQRALRDALRRLHEQ